ncbi:MAG: tetratricopeptide repeat protein, partial [Actinobacteria bacterium]|nr:tetratricopeptide repeat protein [Actinomycetota bacterium]
MSDQTKRRLLFLLFFFSGVSALIYQVIWARMFSLVFGVTTFAVSTVLSAFMAGLSLGSLYFGRKVDKHKNPLRLFAFLEIAIGLYALAFPFLLSQLTHVYIAVYQQLHPGLYIFSIIRFFLAFPLLFIPTALMGGTLPVLSKYFVRELKELGWNIGSLYSVNNLGAVIGSLIAGFFFIKAIGVTGTLYVAAVINIVNGMVSLRMSRLSDAEKANESRNVQVEEDSDAGGEYSRAIIYLVLWVFAIEGFVSLAYEVIWTRMLVFFLGSTIYAFTTMLASFITGLALGSFLIAKFSDRKKDTLSLFGFIELLVGLFVVLFLPFLGTLSSLSLKTPDPFSMSWDTIGMRFLISFLIMLVPTTLMGATFPLVGKIYTKNIRNVGRKIGTLSFLDTIGSIFGAFAGGFLLIPLFGMQRGVLFLGVINIVIGALIIFFHPFMRLKIKRAVALGLGVTAAVAIAANAASDFDFRILTGGEKIEKIYYYNEGISATTEVFEARGEKEIAINGYPVAGTSNQDVEVQKSLAHLPLLIHRNPRNVCIIGFGAGGTSWSESQHDVEEIDCVELVPGVIKAAEYFPEVNHNVLQDPRFNVIIEDGRNYLLTTDRTYDVVTVDATSPKLAGNGNLYSKEFYELCKNRLTEKGIMCQWLPYHLLTMPEIQMIIRTFQEVFPHTTIWFSAYRVYYLLIGTQEKLEIDFASLEKRMQQDKVKKDLAEIRITTPYSLISCFALDEDAVRRQARNSRVNTDNRPYLEYYNPSELNLPASLFPKNEGRPVVVNMDSSQEKILKRYFAAADLLVKVRSYNLQKQDEKAYEEVKKVLALIPDDEIAGYIGKECRIQLAYRYLIEGMNYHDANRFVEAIGRYNQALELSPDWPGVLLNLGIAYNDAGNYDQAIPTLERVTEKDSIFSRAYSNLAVAFINKGMDAKAKDVLQKAIKADPDYPPLYFHLAFLFNEENK